MSRTEPVAAPGHARPVPGRRMRRVAYAMLAMQSAVIAWACFRGFYYFHDDFVFRGQGARQAWFAPAYLFQDWQGHFMPGGFLVAQPLSKLSDFGYGWTALSLALGQALVAWLLLRLLLRHFGSRWRVLVPFGLYLTSVPVVQATTWWAAALGLLPLMACLVLMADHTLRMRSSGRALHYLWVLGAYVAALMFSERAVLAPLVVGMLLLALTPGRLVVSVSSVVRRHGALLVGLVVVTGAWSWSTGPRTRSETFHDPRSPGSWTSSPRW